LTKLHPPAVGLTRAREEKGLNQAELGRLVGMSRSLVNRIESGVVGFKREHAILFSGVLGKTPEELMFPHKEREEDGREKARAVTVYDPDSLPALVQKAAKTLASATSAAEVLDARNLAAVAYDAAKSAARFARAKGAHDTLIAKAHRAQADALDIEAQAKRRLADEYDAAQARGEIQKAGGDRVSKIPNGKNAPLGAAEIGIKAKEIHEARIIRDAEAREPGIVRRTIDQRLKKGQEPTKAALREVIYSVAGKTRGVAPEKPQGRGLRMLMAVIAAGQDLLEAVDKGVVDKTIVDLLDEDEREQLRRVAGFLTGLSSKK